MRLMIIASMYLGLLVSGSDIARAQASSPPACLPGIVFGRVECTAPAPPTAPPDAQPVTTTELLVDGHSDDDRTAKIAVTIVPAGGWLDRGLYMPITGNSLSGLDMYRAIQTGNYIRFLGPNGGPLSQIGSGGQLEMATWITVSGVYRDVGQNRYFIAPTNRQYMIAAWSDIYGPTAVFRSNQYGGPEGKTWPLSLLSGAGRERFRVDDSGNILLGDISGDDVPGERLQLRIGRYGDTGLMIAANDPFLSPGHVLVEAGGWYGAVDDLGVERRLLALDSGGVRLGDGNGPITLDAAEVRLTGTLQLMSATAADLPLQGAAPGSIFYCSDCVAGGAVMVAGELGWQTLTGADPVARAEAAANSAELKYLAVASGGPDAIASRSGSAALGSDASATGIDSVAIGRASRASSDGALAAGVGSRAPGSFATAVGSDSSASGRHALALGSYARAVSDRSLAVGRAASAAGEGSASLGELATANGPSTTALGQMARAQGTGATAVGAGANASQAGSTALGQGATTTAANQVVLGGQGSSVRIGDIEASTAAQSGSVDVVTIDAVGTLGRQKVASAASVAAIGSSLRQALDVSEDRFAALQGQVDQLFDLARIDRKDMRQGLAAVAALASPPMPSGPGRTSYASNVAVFRGEVGVSASLMHRLNSDDPLAVSVAVTYAGGSNTAARIGVAGEF